MAEKKQLCIICAWRATCQKQFAMKAGQRCPEFAEDISLAQASKEQEEAVQETEK